VKTEKTATDNPNCAINDGHCSEPGGRIVTLPDSGERVCNTHYLRWYRLGDARAPAKRGTRKSEIEEWVAAMVAADDGECWPWPFNTYTPEHSPGYGSFGMWRNTTAHRAILLLAAGPPPKPGMFACHKSTCTERPLCVAPWHLYWGTARDNAADMIVDGTRPQGENHYHSLVTEAQAIAIIADRRPYGEIAAEYGVSKRVISDIKQGRTWKHLDRSNVVRGHRSKVTEAMAIAIIPDPHSQIVIAREYGIGEATVNGIKNGTFMPHLDRSNVVIHKRGGEQSPLTEDDVLDIIADPRNYAEIALTYGVSETAIRNIKKGITWKHIDRSGLVDPQRPRGRPKGSSKVYQTVDDGKAMLIILDPRPLMMIARDFGVSTDTIRKIKRGDLFSHLDRSDVAINRPGRHRKGRRAA
jgi:uncharacterized protein YerC